MGEWPQVALWPLDPGFGTAGRRSRPDGAGHAITRGAAQDLSFTTKRRGDPDLSGWTTLAAYDEVGPEGVLKVLDANAGRLKFDPRSRGQRERIGAELQRSASRVAELTSDFRPVEREADVMVYESFGLSPAARSRIEEEYVVVSR